MRTGLKHLLGLSATLVLLVTAMLWVDTRFGGQWLATARVRNFELRIGASRPCCGFAIVDIEDAGSSVRWFDIRRDPQSDASSAAWPTPTEFDLYLVAIEYDPNPHPMSKMLPGLVVYVRWWFACVFWSIPTLLYLRFLYRRRHRHPQPEPSSPSEGPE